MTAAAAGLTYSVEGPSNAGKTSLVRALAAGGDVQVLPDAGDFVTVFPPPPATAEAARQNERYCLDVERARSALVGTGWRHGGECIFDRSALSMLAIAHGYADRFGRQAFTDLCARMAALVDEGVLRLPDRYVVLLVPVAVLRTRNAGRRPPLSSYWMDAGLLARQLEFYRAWASLMGPACLEVTPGPEPADLAASVRAAVRRLGPAPASPAQALAQLPGRLAEHRQLTAGAR
jgi:hypothetical protein